MELLKEVLISAAAEFISKKDFDVDCKALADIANRKEHEILSGIINILSKWDEKDDFEIIEDIVIFLAERGISCGGCHDFG